MRVRASQLKFKLGHEAKHDSHVLEVTRGGRVLV